MFIQQLVCNELHKFVIGSGCRDHSLEVGEVDMVLGQREGTTCTAIMPHHLGTTQQQHHASLAHTGSCLRPFFASERLHIHSDSGRGWTRHSVLNMPAWTMQAACGCVPPYSCTVVRILKPEL